MHQERFFWTVPEIARSRLYNEERQVLARKWQDELDIAAKKKQDDDRKAQADQGQKQQHEHIVLKARRLGAQAKLVRGQKVGKSWKILHGQHCTGL